MKTYSKTSQRATRGPVLLNQHTQVHSAHGTQIQIQIQIQNILVTRTALGAGVCVQKVSQEYIHTRILRRIGREQAILPYSRLSGTYQSSLVQ
jgi:hypothetical protein